MKTTILLILLAFFPLHLAANGFGIHRKAWLYLLILTESKKKHFCQLILNSKSLAMDWKRKDWI